MYDQMEYRRPLWSNLCDPPRPGPPKCSYVGREMGPRLFQGNLDLVKCHSIWPDKMDISGLCNSEWNVNPTAHARVSKGNGFGCPCSTRQGNQCHESISGIYQQVGLAATCCLGGWGVATDVYSGKKQGAQCWWKKIRLNQLIGSQSHQCTGTGVQDFFHQQSQWKSGFTRVFLGGGFNFFYVHPIWGRYPFWLIFFKGVETTN